jgi:geranylgeranyl diphosphate synthase type II
LNKFQRVYTSYRSSVDRRLASMMTAGEPESVYGPIRYVLAGGGKRIRSVLLLLSCGAVGGNPRSALDAAAAIELLHSFTLVHDDVMDHAKLRRGRPTVHTKWDPNIALLAGDELIALAYRSLLRTDGSPLHEVARVFTNAFVQVCEGQGFDKEFELRKNVSLGEYKSMVGKKTGGIIAAAARIGALIGGGTPRETRALYKFGAHLGLAFQIRDDLLDITGDPADLGKAVGSDVVERKKTYLFLKALEMSGPRERASLVSLLGGNGKASGRIDKMREIYSRSGALEAAELEIRRTTGRAERSLEAIGSGRGKDMLLWLSRRLLRRDS